MGKDKGLVQLAGVPLARYVADVLSSVADQVIISVAKGRKRSYTEILGDDFVFVEDEAEGVGPLEGLLQGLGSARAEYVLVSPCDTPFLKKGICEAVARAATGRDGAVPKTGSRYLEPLHGAYRRIPCMEAFAKVLSSGKRTPTLAYHELDIAYVDDSVLRAIDPGLVSFWNINSPEDLRMAEAQVARLR